MMTLRQLRFLTAVADQLNFSRAADVCHVTQPTLSLGIKELEDRLGVTLLERTKQSVMLTPVGVEVVARARRLLLDAHDIAVVASTYRDPFAGNLTLGTIPTIGPFLVPHALPQIRSAYPAMRVYLREEMTESLIAGLQAGRLDLILIALPFETGTLVTELLFSDGYQLATPPQWPAPAQNRPVDFDALGQLMLLEKGHCLQRHALQAYPGRITAHDDDFAATSLPTLIAMVAEGLGITLLPDLAVASGAVQPGQVRLTPLPDACPRRIVLAWRQGSARSVLFCALAEILRNAAP